MKTPPRRANRLLSLVLVILLCADLVHTFRQNLQMRIDGDMAGGVLRHGLIQKIFDDPLAFHVLSNGERYPNPNRFFSHWINSAWFLNVPVMRQSWFSSIDSVYISIALFKTLVQLTILFLLTLFISSTFVYLKGRFLIAALLITPLFQTFGYNHQFGILDQSVTYDFFYALPMIVVLLLYLPVYRNFTEKKYFRPGPFVFLFMCLGILVAVLSGPLNAPIILLINIFFLFRMCGNVLVPKKNRVHMRSQIPPALVCLLVISSLLSVYSMYIGTFNNYNSGQTPSLLERYQRLPYGFWKLVSADKGLLFLAGLIVANVLVLLFGIKNRISSRTLRLFLWVSVFCVVYLTLLPFGGYRNSRPYIIRYDTFMPVSLCLIYMFGVSTCLVVQALHKRIKYLYYFFIIYSLAFFTQKDKMEPKNNAANARCFNSFQDLMNMLLSCKKIAW